MNKYDKLKVINEIILNATKIKYALEELDTDITTSIEGEIISILFNNIDNVLHNSYAYKNLTFDNNG